MIFLLHLIGTAVFYDVMYQKIPNEWIAAGLLCGLAYQISSFHWAGLAMYAAGVFVPVVVLSILYYFRMMGAGDIKLLGVIGGFLGPADGFRCMIYTFLFGGVISAILLIKRRNLFARLFYFKTYFSRYLETKQWSPYMRAEDKDSQMYFSIPVFFSLLCHVMGFY